MRPVSMTAQVRSPPAEIETTFPVSGTVTGLEASVWVPSPSWPQMFQPQHLTLPVDISAHVWLEPPTSCVTPELIPTTFVGEFLFIVLPSPSWLRSFCPQHIAPPPAELIAQAWA